MPRDQNCLYHSTKYLLGRSGREAGAKSVLFETIYYVVNDAIRIGAEI
jgi:hypothetical protein